eukprot:maker-scaffold320_size207635-snap-gene-0.8 protein:Tk09307 transcript:maker-scaffold320_size207635-snap-gene-0.8-mRNA-1 annotation:"PREDICTED: uncharacterized protein LOC100891944"
MVSHSDSGLVDDSVGDYNSRILVGRQFSASSSSEGSQTDELRAFLMDRSGDAALLALADEAEPAPLTVAFNPDLARRRRPVSRRSLRPKISRHFEPDPLTTPELPDLSLTPRRVRPVPIGIDLFTAMRASSSDEEAVTPEMAITPEDEPIDPLTDEPTSSQGSSATPLKKVRIARFKADPSPKQPAKSTRPAQAEAVKWPKTGKLAKASLVFDADDAFEQEYQDLARSGSLSNNFEIEKNMRRKYQTFLRKLKTSPAFKPSSKRTKTPKKAPPGQGRVTDFFRPGSTPADSVASLCEDDFEDRAESIPTIDELLKDLDSPTKKAKTSLAEIRQQFEKHEEMANEKLAEREQKRKKNQKLEDESQAFELENVSYRDRLDRKLTEWKTRKVILDNMDYLQDVWDGKVESKRFQIFQKGGHSAHNLLYHMITDPFSDRHIDWILDEIKKKWMPTEDLYVFHSDFVWKVLLAEALIKIYSDFFGISRGEAEERIQATPCRPEHTSAEGSMIT